MIKQILFIAKAILYRTLHFVGLFVNKIVFFKFINEAGQNGLWAKAEYSQGR